MRGAALVGQSISGRRGSPTMAIEERLYYTIVLYYCTIPLCTILLYYTTVLHYCTILLYYTTVLLV